MSLDDWADLRKFILPPPAMPGLGDWRAGGSLPAPSLPALRELAKSLEAHLDHCRKYRQEQVGLLEELHLISRQSSTLERISGLRELLPVLAHLTEEWRVVAGGKALLGEAAVTELLRIIRMDDEAANQQLAGSAEVALQHSASIDFHIGAVAQAFGRAAEALSSMLAEDEARLADPEEAARAPLPACPQVGLDFDAVVDDVMQRTVKARAFLET